MNMVDERISKFMQSPFGDKQLELGNSRHMSQVQVDFMHTPIMKLLAGYQHINNSEGFKANLELMKSGKHNGPVAVTNLATAVCTDRVGQALANLQCVLASLSFTSSVGKQFIDGVQLPGGGFYDPGLFAGVVYHHAWDDESTEILKYNEDSFGLTIFVSFTHQGHHTDYGAKNVSLGKVKEDSCHHARASCGALASYLAKFDPASESHQRIAKYLGESNVAYLRNNMIGGANEMTGETVNLNQSVLASIFGIRTLQEVMKNYAQMAGGQHLALGYALVELDRSKEDSLIIPTAIMVGRNGVVSEIGLGTDASKYTGGIMHYAKKDEPRLYLKYESHGFSDYCWHKLE